MYFKIHGLYFSQQAMCFFRRPMKSFLHHKKRVYFLTQKTRNSFPAPRIPIIRKTSQQQKSPPFTQFTFRPRKLSAKLQRFLGINIFHAERFFLFAPFQILPCFFFHLVQLGIVIYVPKTDQWFPCSVNVTINRDFFIICHAVTVLIHVIPPVWIDLP